jgi:hypothetical protein
LLLLFWLAARTVELFLAGLRLLLVYPMPTTGNQLMPI